VQDIEATKKEVQDQLKALREENDLAMFEFRANRKLGVELRDLVAEGKIEEAQKMAEEQVGAAGHSRFRGGCFSALQTMICAAKYGSAECCSSACLHAVMAAVRRIEPPKLVLTALTVMLVQVETYLGKLNSDKAYKQEYIKLWIEQRRYDDLMCRRPSAAAHASRRTAFTWPSNSELEWMLDELLRRIQSGTCVQDTCVTWSEVLLHVLLRCCAGMLSLSCCLSLATSRGALLQQQAREVLLARARVLQTSPPHPWCLRARLRQRHLLQQVSAYAASNTAEPFCLFAASP
jgi:hypothetical protein